MKSRVKQRSGRRSDDQLNRVNGCRVELAGPIRERHGYTHEKARKDWICSTSEYQMANMLYWLHPGNIFSVYKN
jgi:uncharacterized protein YjbJ (UPF0337 family)